MLSEDVIAIFKKAVEDINVILVSDKLKIDLTISNDENLRYWFKNEFKQKQKMYKDSVASFLAFMHIKGGTGKLPIEIYDLEQKPLTEKLANKKFDMGAKDITQRYAVALAATVAIRISNPNIEDMEEQNIVNDILHLYDLRDEEGIKQKLLGI